jgi:hypothetical protein
LVEVGVEGLHHILHHPVVGDVAGNHLDVGGGVDGVAHGHELAQGLLRILGLEERAPAALAHPAHQHVELCLQPDRDTALGDPRARGLAHEGASAGGEHEGTLAHQPGDDALLAIAKTRLAVDREDVGDRQLGRRLDLVVGILEHQPEARGEAPPHGALARPHETDEHDRAVAEGTAQTQFDRLTAGQEIRRGALGRNFGHHGHLHIVGRVLARFPVRAKHPAPHRAPNAVPACGREVIAIHARP